MVGYYVLDAQMKIISENTYCCDECNETKGPLVELGPKGDEQVLVCLDCLKKAYALLITPASDAFIKYSSWPISEGMTVTDSDGAEFTLKTGPVSPPGSTATQTALGIGKK